MKSLRKTGISSLVLGLLTLFITTQIAYAVSPTPIGLGTTANFAVLAGTAVTNVPTSTITGDVGLSPAAGSNYDAGVTSAQVTGTIYAVDASGPAGSVSNPGLLTTAKTNLVTAYDDADGRTGGTPVAAGALGGLTLLPGVYSDDNAPDSLGLTGTLTLDAAGDSNAVWIFQSDSTLISAASSSVVLINGAQACNVFWQVGSSATIGANSTFVGTIMALTSITLNNLATVQGRMLARNGAVALNASTITVPTCASAATTPGSVLGVTPGLPDTGASLQEKSIPWWSIFVAITVAAAITYFVRKQLVSNKRG